LTFQEGDVLPIRRDFGAGNLGIAEKQLPKPLNKTRNIWVKKMDEPFRQSLSDHQRNPAAFRRMFGAVTASTCSLFRTGRVNFNLYDVNPADPAAPGTKVPAARNLTDIKGVRVVPYAVLGSEPDNRLYRSERRR
jgi:hypothetical protein